MRSTAYQSALVPEVRVFALNTLVLLPLFLGTVARAYTPLIRNGKQLKWSTKEISYYVNPSGSGIPTEQLIGAIENSFRSWSETGAGLAFHFAGLTDAKHKINDGKNIIFWDVEREWVPADALARALPTWDSETGEILDVDIGFNNRDGIFLPIPSLCAGGFPNYIINPSGLPLIWNIGQQHPRYGSVNLIFDDFLADVQATATHEIGHLLGLDHSAVPEASMSTVFQTPSIYCTTTQALLKTDDIEGIQFLYASATPPNQPPTAGFSMSYGGQIKTEGQTLDVTVPAGEIAFVSFSGARSSDPDGTVVTWEWKSNGTRIPNANFTGNSFTFGFGAGTHVITLIVKDSLGLSSAVAQGILVVAETAPADLTLSKTDSPDPVTSGGTITYTLTVQNIGGSPAQNVSLTDFLPASDLSPSCSTTGGTCSAAGATVTAQIGALATGGIATVTITIRAPITLTPISIGNTASVSTTSPELNTANNQAAASTTVLPLNSLNPMLFYDPAISNASFGEPVIDSQGRLLVVSSHFNNICGFGFCGTRLHSIAPTGSPNWQVPNDASFISSDSLASRGLAVGPNDEVYLQGARNTLFAYDSAGNAVSSLWPATIVPTGASGTVFFKGGTVVDLRDGTVYLKAGVTQSFSTFPTVVVALNPDGTEKWRKDYPDDPATGYGLVQGPVRDLYTIITNRALPHRFVSLDHGSGNQACETPATAFFGSLVAGLEGVFTSFHSDITAWDANCVSQLIFTSPRGDVELRVFGQAKIFGMDYPVSPFDATQVRLLAVSKEGGYLWRNSEIVVPHALGNPIRAIKNDVLYVLGQHLTDGNRPKLFLVDANSGQILNSIGTSGLCESCGVAVSQNGTIYLNDLNSTRIYKLN